jgi:uncharacterized membrane protein
MKRIVIVAFSVSILAVIVFSCKTTKKTASSAPAVSSAVLLTYNRDIKTIVDKYCNTCHDKPGKKKGDFTTYAGLKEKIDNGSFKAMVFDKKKMPPANKEPLTDDAYSKLKNWFDSGASE